MYLFSYFGTQVARKQLEKGKHNYKIVIDFPHVSLYCWVFVFLCIDLFSNLKSITIRIGLLVYYNAVVSRVYTEFRKEGGV